MGADQRDPYGLLELAAATTDHAIVILEDVAYGLDRERGDARARALLGDLITHTRHPEGLLIVMLEAPEAEGHVPPMLAPQVQRVSVPYPRADELARVVREEVGEAYHATRAPIPAPADLQKIAGRFAPALVGLTHSAARDALRDALAPGVQDLEAAYRQLEQRKRELLRRSLSMNVLDTDAAEMPVGLDYLMQYLDMMRSRMRQTGPGRARGVLLIGPPGTGKTLLARAVGQLVGLPVVEFRIASLMNSLLGETERLFAQAFETLAAMAPNVVFIDEIEKAFGDSSERDGGTMMRVTGSLLSWLSDNPHPNYIIATSNSLRRMGEIGLTMTRSERFDRAYFVDVPSRDARTAMLRVWLSQTGIGASAHEVAAALAAQTERFSGADLRSVVKQAEALAAYRREPLALHHLMQEVSGRHTRVEGLYSEFQELRRWGRLHCDPAGPTDALAAM